MSADAVAEIVLDVVEALPDIIPRIARLWQALGSRDAVLAALDTALVAARAKTDADLDRKWGAE